MRRPLLALFALAIATAAMGQMVLFPEWAPAQDPNLRGRVAVPEQLVVGGSDPGADTVPLDSRLSAQNAWPGAATNITGGNLFLAGGMGVTKLEIADYTLLADTSVRFQLDLTLPSATDYSLIEGVHFSAETSNAATAANISAAVNAWCPGVTASVTGTSVLIAKTANTQTLSINCAYGTIYGITNGTAGKVYTSTPLYVQDEARFGANTYHSGSTMILPKDKAVNPGTSDLQTDEGTVYNITGPQIGNIQGGVLGRVVLLRFGDAVGGVALTAFTPAPGLSTYAAVVGGWLLLYYDGSHWIEQGRYPLGVTKTLTWYGATTSGGEVTTQYTLTIVNGVITGATP